MDNIFSDTPLHGAIAWATLAYILIVAAVPWTAGRGGGGRPVLVRTAAALVGLGILSSAVILQCEVGYCGHGAMILPALLALAGVAAVVTVLSAAVAWVRSR
ncbi:MAG TPA: hypothetical protein VG900_14470 [Hyphomicrobiaceae bacterium]|jgi:hypothetical protein|nr:hypothetical protein [Hyphomicrobiaceae bacterium]